MQLSKPIVWISNEHRNFIFEETRDKWPMETGGVLLGYRLMGDEFIVKAVVGPGCYALHEATRFVPDYVYHEREVARLYEESLRIHTYLGDWHSHPNQNSVSLSPKDTETMKRIALFPHARAPRPLMIISYRNSRNLDMKAWMGRISNRFFIPRVLHSEALINIF